jgi:hypothetical protein
MRTIKHLGFVIIAIIPFVVTSAVADGSPSGLAAHISTATNRVSALSGLEFSIVLTNNGPTNVTIFPDCFIYGTSTIALLDPQGGELVQRPRHEPPTVLDSRPLKPGESFTFTNKLSDVILHPGHGAERPYEEVAGSRRASPGKYHARYGGPDSSNVVEITIE